MLESWLPVPQNVNSLETYLPQMQLVKIRSYWDRLGHTKNTMRSKGRDQGDAVEAQEHQIPGNHQNPHKEATLPTP